MEAGQLCVIVDMETSFGGTCPCMLMAADTTSIVTGSVGILVLMGGDEWWSQGLDSIGYGVGWWWWMVVTGTGLYRLWCRVVGVDGHRGWTL